MLFIDPVKFISPDTSNSAVGSIFMPNFPSLFTTIKLSSLLIALKISLLLLCVIFREISSDASDVNICKSSV